MLLLAGDTTFTEEQLLANEVVDLSMDARRSRRTMSRIRRLCGYERGVYLTTHDPEAAERLESRTPTVIDGSDRP